MKLLSVNVSQPKEIIHNGKPVMTGIFKVPVQGRVMLHELNLDGDRQADLRAHGGPYKAVYAYPYEHYATWASELNRDDFTYGQFGENFTVEGMTEDEVHIGDVFRIGTAFVEVTQPRVPCFKLEHKMDIPGFIKPFLKSERTGFYLKVLEEGEVGAGDDIERVQLGAGQMSVRQIHHLLYIDHSDTEAIKQAAKLAALSPGWRESFQKMLEKA